MNSSIQPSVESYYMNLLVKKEFGLNKKKLKEYFPLELVTRETLNIYQEMLGLKFIKLKHPEVRVDFIILKEKSSF